MDIKNEFLLASIQDIQSTIRALDYKVSAILAGIIAPLAIFGHITSNLYKLAEMYPNYGIILIFFFCLMWLCALLSAVLTVGFIDNPSTHITNINKVSGFFYQGGIFEFSFRDVLYGNKRTSSKKDLPTLVAEVPSDEASVTAELVYEQIKLVYIRGKKMLRLRCAFIFCGLWLFSGIVVYLITHGA